jgi:glycosyltransferase involved in cell wall biosynthesis
MRILFLVTQSKESPSGGGRYWPLAKALVGLGHEVTIIALHHNYHALDNRQYMEDGVQIKYVGQMHVRKIGNEKIYYGSLRMLFVALMATIKLTWAALRTPADVLHVCKTQPMNGIAGWLVHLLRRMPVYIDSDDHESVNNRFAARWQQKVVAWFENWLPSFARGLTVGTTFSANHFKGIGYPSERIFLVINGVERKRFEILHQAELADRLASLRSQLQIEGRQTVVYIGSISLTSHAIDILLQAFVEVTDDLPETRLLLVGAGEDLDRLQKMAADLGIQDNVHFVGRIPMEEVPLYYRLGALSVDPRHQSPQAESSLSLKLVESIVAGVPCVTADIGDLRQVAGEAGIAIKPDDPQALAQAIVAILSDPDLQEELQARSLEKRESLFWDNRVHMFTRVYN